MFELSRLKFSHNVVYLRVLKKAMKKLSLKTRVNYLKF